MRIAETDFYKKMTEFLRRDPVKQFVKFNAEGLVYDNDPELYISLKRLSKNNYCIICLYADEKIKNFHRTLGEAIDEIQQILKEQGS